MKRLTVNPTDLLRGDTIVEAVCYRPGWPFHAKEGLGVVTAVEYDRVLTSGGYTGGVCARYTNGRAQQWANDWTVTVDRPDPDELDAVLAFAALGAPA